MGSCHCTKEKREINLKKTIFNAWNFCSCSKKNGVHVYKQKTIGGIKIKTPFRKTTVQKDRIAHLTFPPER